MEKKLPYRVEYAKSGRAVCRKCQEIIEKDSLRLAVMVQSTRFDGMQPLWHHYSCFFGKYKPKDVSDISHFESIRWDDQEKIIQKIKSLSSITTSRKRSKVEIPDLGDYIIGYAKSGQSRCKVCEEYISKKEIRVSKKNYEGEIALMYGPTERWHHIDCFLKAREELGFFASGEVLPGFKSLDPDDQKLIKEKIPKIARSDVTDGPSPPKISRNDNKANLKKQNDTIFKYHDSLKNLSKNELISLMKFNNQEIPEGVPRMIDRLSDAMSFGALEKCKDCNGQLTFRSGFGYQCLGYISEWAKCQKIFLSPSRVVFQVPPELKQKHEFLKKYKGKVAEKLFMRVGSTDTSQGQKIPLLTSLKFLIHKTENTAYEELKKQIVNFGGSVTKSFDQNIVAVISTKAELTKSKMVKPLKLAKEMEIPVLPDSIFSEISSTMSRKELINFMETGKISTWNSDLSSKVKDVTIEKESVYSKKSVFSQKSQKKYKSEETVKKITLKDGLAVDPDSQLDKIAHVYRRGDEIFSVVLSLADVHDGKNSYYRLQVLEADNKKKYWVFRAWGRIGTTIGGNKCERYGSLEECIEFFKEQFLEQTGNEWEGRKNFKKLPGKKLMLDIQYCDETKKVSNEKPRVKTESKLLPKSVQDLITFIFDIEAMERTMMEFELDLTKMPLGKISQQQILKAFSILSELQNFINSSVEKSFIIEKTNKFYTLVPHDFGINTPPLLDNENVIKEKIDMLNNLRDIEIAYSMLQECEKSDNSIDEHYNKLNTKITEVDPNSEEFKIIEKSVKKTHAKTHNTFTLEIENVFKIERNGEEKRYKKFNKFSNRKLLWHGSRTTNFAGILSQGLRIAPPEAPVTGYMFGKGVYFADMVSKSANYCNTSKNHPTGLLLLCEVALGEIHELTEADYIEKLPAGKHSVKGLGKTEPDPSEIIRLPSGAEIFVGEGVKSKVKKSSLLYNEYIVYNVAQIKIQYLLRLKFNHKI